MQLCSKRHVTMSGHKMQLTYFIVVVFASALQHTFAYQRLFVPQIPQFIHKCQVSDPKFDECVLKSANSFLSSIYHGDDKYGIQPMKDSGNVTKTYNLTENFHLNFTELTPSILGDFVFTSMHFDFATKMLTFSGKLGHRVYHGIYEAYGEILGKPAHESGKANFTFESSEFNATAPLEFKTKYYKKYLEVVSCTLSADFKDFHFIPYDQVAVGEPMTAEQKKEYQSYIDRVPELFKKQHDYTGKDYVRLMNSVFEMEPFEDIFLP